MLMNRKNRGRKRAVVAQFMEDRSVPKKEKDRKKRRRKEKIKRATAAALRCGVS